MSKTLKKYILGLMATAVVGTAMSWAEESEDAGASASLDVAVLSSYVWRGQVLNDEAVLQPTFGISKGGFTISWWGNLNLTDQITGDEYEFSEHDIALSYGFTCPMTGADASIGVVNFDFPNVAISDDEGNVSLVNDTREAFISYGFGNVLLSPTVTVNYDFKEAEGFYGSLGISHSVSIADSISLDLGASLGAATSDWGDFYFGKAEGLTDYSISASLPIAMNETFTIKPVVSYSALLGDAKDAVDDSDDSLYFGKSDHFVFGVNASYSF